MVWEEGGRVQGVIWMSMSRYIESDLQIDLLVECIMYTFPIHHSSFTDEILVIQSMI